METYETEEFNDVFSRASHHWKESAIEQAYFAMKKMKEGKKVDQVEGIPRKYGKYLELKITGADRLIIALAKGKFILYRIGNHDITKKVKKNPEYTDAIKCAPSLFALEPSKSKNIKSKTKTGSRHELGEVNLPEEYNDDTWLFFLSEQQTRCRDELVSEIVSGKGGFHLILGGPGTGKTSILAEILYSPATKDLSCAFVCSNDMKQFIESIDPNLLSHIVTYPEFPFGYDLALEGKGLLLFDDPPDPQALQVAFNHWWQNKEKKSPPTVIVGLDPMQLSWAANFTDKELGKYIRSSNTRRYLLDVAYRQRKEIGEWSAQCIENLVESSPFLRSDKIADHKKSIAEISKLSKPKIFDYPGGYLAIENVEKQEAAVELIGKFCSSLLPSRSHGTWVDLLFLIEEGNWTPDNSCTNKFGLKIHFKNFSDFDSLRGVEYKYGIFVISQETLNALSQPTRGNTRRGQDMIKHYRIPISRIRDRLLVLVV